MSENRGKKFERVIREAFEKVPGVSIDRLHDQTNGFKGSQNICDFIVYREPYEYYFECKSVQGRTLSIHSIPGTKDGKAQGFYGNITDRQWNGLLEKSKIPGVFAGIICWWVDKDITRFIPIQTLYRMYHEGVKSVNCYWDIYTDVHLNPYPLQEIKGKKKRVFFDYDMEEFLNGFNDR